MNPVVKFYEADHGSPYSYLLGRSRSFTYPTLVYEKIDEGIYAGVLSNFFDYSRDNTNEANNYLTLYFEKQQLAVLVMNNMPYRDYQDIKSEDLFMIDQEIILHVYDLNYKYHGSVIVPLEDNRKPVFKYIRSEGRSIFYSANTYSKLNYTSEDIMASFSGYSAEFISQLIGEFKENESKIKKWERSPDISQAFYMSYWKPGANSIAKKNDDEEKDKRRIMQLRPTGRSLDCSNSLYGEVNNGVQIVYIKSKSESAPWYTLLVSANTTLVADSIEVTKLNDSMYNLRPRKMGGCKVYLVNMQNNEKIDSTVINCSSQPISLGVTNFELSHRSYYAAQLFPHFEHLGMYSARRLCHDYAKDYFPQSYDLEFVRNDEILAQITIKGDYIPESFRNELMKNIKLGDILWVKNVVLIGKDKSVIRIDKQPIFVIR
jgi:hypothetical protein